MMAAVRVVNIWTGWAVFLERFGQARLPSYYHPGELMEDMTD
jgi:hypothetical protein